MIKKVILTVGTVILVGGMLLWIFAVTFQQSQYHKPFSLRSTLGTHRHRPVAVADIVHIAPWMTFDYINKLFALPETYLQESLQIRDTKYPFITVGKYAKKINVPNNVLVENIRNDVERYLASSSTQP